MKTKSVILLGIILIYGYTSGYGQCKEGWPQDKKKAEECVVIYTDAYKAKNYRGATSSLQWMLVNAPKWNTKLYIDGTDIYDNLAQKEQNPAKRKILVDSMLLLFDLRAKYCGDNVNVLNRKTYAASKFYSTKEEMKRLLKLYDSVYSVSGNDVTDANLVSYITTVKKYQDFYKNLSEDQILERFDKIITLLDMRSKKATDEKDDKSVDKYKLYKDAVESTLTTLVKLDCDYVRKNLAPNFQKNPNDLVLAKKIFNYMLQGKCSDDPVWLQASETIHKLNPEKDFGLLKVIIARYMSEGNYDKAEDYLKEGMNLAVTADQKSDVNLLSGSIEVKKGDFTSARNYFLKAGNANGYEKIGDLYYNSFSNCAKKVSQAEDRLVYIAAYEMYQKAGNGALMNKAKSQFPSKEDIFLLNWTEGSSQKVGCWINQTVTLSTRD